jgi:riboflavin biosynthesis pyrimidine reductase
VGEGEPVRFRRLTPDPADGLSAEDLVAQIRPAPRDGRPYVLLNMIASLDGRASLHGATKDLGHPADRALFHSLRTIADAVLVGAGTVRAEGYRELIRDEELYAAREARGLEREPRLAVVSGGGEGLGEPAPQTRRTVYPDPQAALHDLRGTVLCEGGPSLNAELLAAGLVDELHLCVASLLVGGEDPLTIVSGAALEPPLRPRLRSVHESGGYLFLRYMIDP